MTWAVEDRVKVTAEKKAVIKVIFQMEFLNHPPFHRHLFVAVVK